MLSRLKSFPLIFIWINGFCQIKEIEKSNISLEKYYLGLHGEQVVRTDTAKLYNNSSLRFGALIAQKFNSQLKIRSFALLKFETNELIKSSGSFEFVYQPKSTNRLQIGYVGTAISELRPNPLTPESQTEFKTQSRIPGARPTIKYFHELTRFTSFSTSFSITDSYLGYQLKISTKKIGVGLQLEKYNNIGVLDFQLKSLRGISVLNFSKKEFDQTFICVFKEYQLYLENQINSISKTRNFEIGIRNSFVYPLYDLKGFIGISYNNSDKIISCSLFANFNKKLTPKY